MILTRWGHVDNWQLDIIKSRHFDSQTRFSVYPLNPCVLFSAVVSLWLRYEFAVVSLWLRCGFPVASLWFCYNLVQHQFEITGSVVETLQSP